MSDCSSDSSSGSYPPEEPLLSGDFIYNGMVSSCFQDEITSETSTLNSYIEAIGNQVCANAQWISEYEDPTVTINDVEGLTQYVNSYILEQVALIEVTANTNILDINVGDWANSFTPPDCYKALIIPEGAWNSDVTLTTVLENIMTTFCTDITNLQDCCIKHDVQQLWIREFNNNGNVVGSVADGTIITSSSSLDIEITNVSTNISSFMVNGCAVQAVDDDAFTLDSNADNYIWVAEDGTYDKSVVAVGAAAPTVDGMIIWNVTTNATGVVSSVDLRNTYFVRGSVISDSTIENRSLIDNSISKSKLADNVVGAVVGDSEFIRFEYDNKGLVVDYDYNINLDSLMVGDILWFDGTEWTTGNFVFNALPTGSVHETLYHNGTIWTNTNNMINTGTNVGIDITTGLAYHKLHMGRTAKIAHRLSPTVPLVINTLTNGTQAAGTYFYAYTIVDCFGNESDVSTERDITITAGQSVALGTYLTDGGEKIRFYRGTTSGTYDGYWEVDYAASWNDTGEDTLTVGTPTTSAFNQAVSSALYQGKLALGKDPGLTGVLAVQSFSRYTTVLADFNLNVDTPFADSYTIKAVNDGSNDNYSNIALYAYAENSTNDNIALHADKGDIVIDDAMSVLFVGSDYSTRRAKALAQFDSTSKGLLIPRWNNTEEAENILVLQPEDKGLLWYNTNDNVFRGWNGLASYNVGPTLFGFNTISSDSSIQTKKVNFIDSTSGTVTVTLPNAVSESGNQIIIKKIDSSSNPVTIDTVSSQTIDGQATQNITTQYESYTLLSNGLDWYII